MAAAFELSRPQHGYEVTVFQQGWRLGGKGASGRGRAGRIEEHGLHVWMGYYENAFRLMREAYDELARNPNETPLATWRDAFIPASHVAAADVITGSAWDPWAVRFAENNDLPGDAAAKYRPLGTAEYLAQTVDLVRRLIASTLNVDLGAGVRAAPGPAGRGASAAFDLTVLGGLGGVLEALRQVDLLLRQNGATPDERLAGESLRILDAVVAAARSLLENYVRNRDRLRRLWGVVDVALAAIRGTIRAGITGNPRGFDVLDGYDCREWLKMNGASDLTINNSFVRALYDLGFAYEDGDPERPRIAAGAGMRGSFRAFYTYRGAFFWKMTAGMGDVVFAPLYEVLRRRGVKFEFFHRLTNVRLGGPRGATPFVSALEFDVQARVNHPGGYRPLVDVAGVPSWPAAPDWSQLSDGEQLRAQRCDFESSAAVAPAEARTLTVDDDFDFVVLAVGVGALPAMCKELIARDERWRVMTETTKTVATRAFQLWLRPTMKDLGWPGDPVSLTGFVEPFDTWADMSHLVKAERVTPEPGAIAYFCSVLPDGQSGPHADPAAAALSVKRDAIAYLDRDLGALWPKARASDGHFRWDILHDFGSGASRATAARFDTQYWRANVNPTDRYTLSLPGSIAHRLSPLDVAVDNLTVAGDWTASGLNLGCVEGAVMSGLLAAHAICQSPSLSSIVGYDHP